MGLFDLFARAAGRNIEFLDLHELVKNRAVVEMKLAHIAERGVVGFCHVEISIYGRAAPRDAVARLDDWTNSMHGQPVQAGANINPRRCARR